MIKEVKTGSGPDVSGLPASIQGKNFLSILSIFLNQYPQQNIVCISVVSIPGGDIESGQRDRYQSIIQSINFKGGGGPNI